jgi:epoxyqueuosine reductase
MMNRLELAKIITDKAFELGLHGVGFAPAVPPVRAALFRRWLDEGEAANMTYLNRSADKRTDPRLVLDGARTIITVTHSYFTGRLPEEIRHDPSRGIIASYAWGRDYHEVLLRKLESLAQFIEGLAPEVRSKCYVDSGPVMERDYGERAGLGFIGKNTLLIAPRMGSTFFIGEIVTSLELPPTPPARMPSCGSCTQCLEVCPTHALPTAYVLDSRLCISYLTIEYKGVIPRELARKMGNHIFGCDDCQDCCPWNLRFSAETDEVAYQGALNRQAPLLRNLAAMTEGEFRERFAHSPVLRSGYAGFLRNVAVVASNWESDDGKELLRELENHSESLVRAQAAELLKD